MEQEEEEEKEEEEVGEWGAKWRRAKIFKMSEWIECFSSFVLVTQDLQLSVV